MKTNFLVMFIILTVALGGVCLWQGNQLRQAKARGAETQRQLEAAREARTEEERRANAMERRQAALNEQLYEVSGVVAALRASGGNTNITKAVLPGEAKTGSATNQSEVNGLFGGGNMARAMAKMMKDPAMKEMVRSQQKMSMNMMYGPLFKEMTLTTEEREKFSELLLDQQTKAMEAAEKMLGEGSVAAFPQPDALQEPDNELKALLGEERFAQYQEYKKEMGERMQVEQFRQQVSGTESALQGDQMKQLVRLMREEGERVPHVIAQDPQQVPANFETVLSGDMMEKHFQRQEEINRRVLARAGEVLTPAQLKTYADFQAEQMNMQRIGIKMTREMLGAGGAKKE